MDRNNFGTFQARAYTASGALPVPRAVVKITGADETNGDIQYSLVTDLDGLTDQIRLPTAEKNYSLEPDSREAPYSIYDIQITKNGYYTKTIHSIPIFEGTLAVLPIEMIPLSYTENGDIRNIENLNATVYENENL